MYVIFGGVSSVSRRPERKAAAGNRVDMEDTLLWILGVLLLLFCSVDVWYYIRAVFVVVRAWFLAPVFDITGEQTAGGRVVLHDVDLCHMNNARYLRECDFARLSLYTRNGVFKATRALGATMVVGATTIRYRRPLCVGEAFELRSRIITWDDKSFYLEQRFVSCKDGMVSAVMFCKQNVLRSDPDKILQYLCKRKVEVPEFPKTCSTGSISSQPAVKPSGENVSSIIKRNNDGSLP